MNDTVINDGGVGGRVVIDLENYITKKEGVLKGDFQRLENLVNDKSSMSHKHRIGDIRDLQETLILKSETDHKHSVDDVSGLEGRLTTVETSKADINHKHNTLPLSDDLVIQKSTISNHYFIEAFQPLSDNQNLKFIIGESGEKGQSAYFGYNKGKGGTIGLPYHDGSITFDMNYVRTRDPLIAPNVKEDNETRLAALETKVNAASVSTLAVEETDNLQTRIASLESVNVSQSAKINELETILKNHAEVIKTLADKVGIEVEK